MNAVSLPVGLHVALVCCAARHSTSVEAVVREAILAYIADVETGLLSGPMPEPAHVKKLRMKQGAIA